MQRVPRLCVLLVALLMACASGEIKPVAIESNDMCSFCKMAISQKQFAAEIIAKDDSVLKFDDIGCLLRYREAGGDKLTVAAIFVTDYESGQWLRADDAFFVRSKTIKTPMGSGIVAFGDPSKAGSESASARFAELKP